MNRHLRHLEGCVAVQTTSHLSKGSEELHVEMIARHPSTLRRSGLLVIHHASAVLGTPVWRHFFKPYERRGLRGLGIGYTSTVVTDGREVIKILRGSGDLNRYEGERQADELGMMIEINSRVHPRETVPTEIVIAPDPATMDSVIILKQALIEGDDTPPEDAVQREAALARNTLDQMLPLGYITDVAGFGNLIYQDGKLMLIDTVPLPVEPRTIRNQIPVLERMAQGARVYDDSRT